MSVGIKAAFVNFDVILPQKVLQKLMLAGISLQRLVSVHEMPMLVPCNLMNTALQQYYWNSLASWLSNISNFTLSICHFSV